MPSARAIVDRLRGNAHGLLLAAVLLGALGARLYRLGDPPGALIFDEAYYVQAARVIDGQPVLFSHLSPTSASGLDPNEEHPPLAKLIMAGSIHLLGDRGFAWRLPSVLAGMGILGLIHAIARALGASRWASLFAVFVVSFENLSFVHARIATLDVYLVAFMLLGAWLYLIGWWEIAAVAFGLSTLCKINGVSGPVCIVLYEAGLLAVARQRPDRALVARIARMLGIYAAFTFTALGALDGYWTRFSSPVDHIAHIFRHGMALVRPTGPQGVESHPLDWWLNEAPINYVKVESRTGSIITKKVLVRGMMTGYVIFAAPFALIQSAVEARRGDRLALFAVCSFVATYVPVLAAGVLSSRISYIYYFLPSIPAVALALIALGRSAPAAVRWSFVAAMLAAFGLSFPFRG